MEENIKPSRLLDHEGISVTAGEGLAGGGCIDRSIGLRVDIMGLPKGSPRMGTEVFMYYDPEENQLTRCTLVDMGHLIFRALGLDARFAEAHKEIEELRKKIEIFSIYERLQKLEEKNS